MEYLFVEIGGGKSPKEGFVNVDIIDHPSVDYVLDLNTTPLPFEDNSVAKIYSSHCLEHLDGKKKFVEVMEEMYRVSKPGAMWEIKVPYANMPPSTGNPYHTNDIFNEYTFYFFSEKPHPYYPIIKKGTANEDTKTTLRILEQNFRYFKDSIIEEMTTVMTVVK